MRVPTRFPFTITEHGKRDVIFMLYTHCVNEIEEVEQINRIVKEVIACCTYYMSAGSCGNYII